MNDDTTEIQPVLRFDMHGRAVSANTRLGYDRRSGRPHLTSAARQWKAAVAAEAFVADALRAAKSARALRLPLRVVCHVYGTCADADNLSKLVIDGLKEGIGVDDRYFGSVEMHATRQQMKTPHTLVEVYEAAEVEAAGGMSGGQASERWTSADVAHLRSEVSGARDPDWAEIARALGRSESACRRKAQRLGLLGDPGYSQIELARLLGVSSVTVGYWRERGMLAGTQMHGYGHGQGYRYSRRAVRAFVRSHPDACNRERVDLSWLVELLASGGGKAA